MNPREGDLSIPGPYSELPETASSRTNGTATMLMNYGHNNLSNRRGTMEVSDNVPPPSSSFAPKASKWISN